MERWKKLWLSVSAFFPEQEIFAHKLPVRAQVAVLVGLGVVFTGVGYFLPANGFLAFDWLHFFGIGRMPPYYPPWVKYVVYLTWPGLVGITLAAVCLAIVKRAAHPLSAIFAFLALPLFWTVFLGQLDGLVVLGLIGLPWLAPLALLKPQISLFAFAARRSYLLALGIVVGVSFFIWGPWPLQMLAVRQYHVEGRYVNDIALGWWGLPLALLLLWWSRGDMDMLMVGGSFASPYLIPYSFLPIVPAIARLSPRAAALTCFFSWLPFSANWLGPAGWWLGWVFVAWLWLSLAATRYPQNRFSIWLKHFTA